MAKAEYSYPKCKDSRKLTPMTFYPTLKEWKDLPRYVMHLETTYGAHIPGIVKIKAPAGWDVDRTPREERYNPSNMTDIDVGRPLQQTMKPTTTTGAFETTSLRMPPLSVEKYVKLSTSARHVTPPHESYEELEEIYWNTETLNSSDDPVYGADVPADRISFNRAFNTDKNDIFADIGKRVTMVEETGSYLYIGMWKSTFSWHIEDMDLYANNYLHYGAPKNWYCVPPDQAYKLEAALGEIFPYWRKNCFNFMRHKICMTNPKLLAKYGITVNKVVQEERDMIIVFPHAYHSGFNHGFNIAEASNFGTKRWIEYGKRHRPCQCADSDKFVEIDMEPFIAKYQPGRLDAWKAGLDAGLHPSDSQEMRDVWSFCEGVVAESDSLGDNVLDISAAFESMGGPNKEKENNISESKEESSNKEEKRQLLRKLCLKQLQHFKHYRDILPQVKEVMRLLDPSWYPEQEEEEEEEWEVEAIVDKRGHGNSVEYLVKWKDWDPSTNTWEPLQHLECHELIEEYETKDRVKDMKVNNVMLSRAAKCKVNMREHPKEELEVHLKRLNERLSKKSPKKAKLDNGKGGEIIKKFGFADITAEELEAKKNLKKCWFKHKLWNCRKCAGCVKPDCGKCWACKDKPKFGGRGVQKQKCQERKCSNPEVRGCDKCTWNI